MLCLLERKTTNSICVVQIGVMHFSVCVASVAHTFLMGGISVSEYKELYRTLFNGVTDTIEELKKLQQKVEDEYLKLTDKEDEKVQA